jgi:3-isopropylmalate dehydrogenase
VQAEHTYIDAQALYLVQRPERFDVLVTENMFGDILSDLGAGLVGGMGMAPSADIGREHAVFQPSHGSAPDIAGRGIANPVGQVWTGALMLEHLGHAYAAAAVHGAIERALDDPAAHTPDLGGQATTEEATEALLAAL